MNFVNFFLSKRIVMISETSSMIGILCLYLANNWRSPLFLKTFYIISLIGEICKLNEQLLLNYGYPCELVRIFEIRTTFCWIYVLSVIRNSNLLRKYPSCLRTSTFPIICYETTHATPCLSWQQLLEWLRGQQFRSGSFHSNFARYPWTSNFGRQGGIFTRQSSDDLQIEQLS